MNRITLGTIMLASVAGYAADPPAMPESKDRPVGATVQQHIILPAGEVKWGEGTPSLPPGAKMAVIEGDPKAANALFTLRFKMPDGYAIPPHYHPADEHVTVISGTFNMGMGSVLDKKLTTVLPAGSFAVMPRGHPHFAFARGETVVQLHGVGPWGITYLNPADDPRNAKMK